jgi:hypothetical protein
VHGARFLRVATEGSSALFGARKRPSGRGSTLAANVGNTLSAILGTPFVAAALGALLGVVLLRSSRGAYAHVDPDDPTGSYFAIIYPMVLRFAVVIAALFVYFTFMRDAMIPFSLGLLGGFLAAANVELWKYARIRKRKLLGKGGW